MDDDLKNWYTKYDIFAMVWMLTGILALQYLDRQIIAGGATSIKETFNITTASLGFLQSSFMLGYVVGALVFAQLVARKIASPKSILSFSIYVWMMSCLLSGASGFVPNINISGVNTFTGGYYLMLFARALSGLGEAALSTFSMPFLDRVLEEHEKGFYVGSYYSALPVGGALGYIWVGIIADVTGFWQIAFFLEMPLMLPLLYKFQSSPVDFRISGPNANDHLPPINKRLEIDIQAPLLGERDHLNPFDSPKKNPFDENFTSEVESIGFCKSICTCLSSPVYLLGVIGYAVYTGVVAGLAFYAPQFLQSYRPDDIRWRMSQQNADILFGCLVSSAGILGTMLGGSLLDAAMQNASRKAKNILDSVTNLIILEILGGMAISSVMIAMTNPVIFFTLFFIGVGCFFTVSSSVNLLLIWSVPPENRPMASALTVVIIHLFGDVPSPILLGFISDHTTPLMTLTIALFTVSITVFFWAFIRCLPLQLKSYQP